MIDIGSIMRMCPMIPVLIVEDVAQARAIAESLVAGGLRVLEVTLRTPAALDVIREMSRVEGAVVGAGTVLNETQLQESIDAGARFAVSPGLTERIGRAAIASGSALLPPEMTRRSSLRLSTSMRRPSTAGMLNTSSSADACPGSTPYSVRAVA